MTRKPGAGGWLKPLSKTGLPVRCGFRRASASSATQLARWVVDDGSRGVVVRTDFEIRVAGEVPAEVLADLRNAHFVQRGVETVLHGPVEDQAALIGIINWLQMLGVELREVRQISPSEQHLSTGQIRGNL